MSDVSKTNELIEELRGWTVDDAPHSIVSLIHRAADALEAATRVPVQGEPNGAVKAVIDRDVAIDAIAGGTISVPGGYGVLHGDDAANIVDAIIGHATVPDAATAELLRRQQRYIEELENVDVVGLKAERDAALVAAEARLQAVRELHAKMVQPSGWAVCSHCEEGMLQDPADWPCPTIEALGEAS